MPPRGDAFGGARGSVAAPRGGGFRRRIEAEARWAHQRFIEARDRQRLIPCLETPTRTPDRFRDVRIEKDARIPMRDGVNLAADIYSPAPAHRLPTVLIRMPYGKDRHYAMPARGKFWARKGYHCVIQDVRGRGRSQGEWVPLQAEAADGYDTLGWLAAQPWCDGNIGMVGESYYGMTQWAVAGSGHPNLRCIAPGHTACDMYDVVHPGGAFMHTTLGLWSAIMETRRDRNPFRFDPWHLPLSTSGEAAGCRGGSYRDYVTHWRRDEWWEARRLHTPERPVGIPIFEWGGWYDLLLAGTLGDWRMLTRSRSPGSAPPAHLMIGPTDHAFSTMETNTAGRVRLTGDWLPFDRVERFVDRWLRPGHETAATTEPVEVYRVGAGEWLNLREWPPPAEPTRLYLHSGGGANSFRGDGILDAESPQHEPCDVMVYDPADPVGYWLSRDLWEAARHLGDRQEVEARADVLVYTSAPLDAPLEILGEVRAVLHASSSCPDTDLTAALVDVFPDGYAQLVQEGVLRARFREGLDREVFLDPESVYPLEIDLVAASHTFAPGHRVRLEVSSSNFGRWDRNLNTADTLGMGVESRRALNRVHHEAGRPSYLELPVYSP